MGEFGHETKFEQKGQGGGGKNRGHASHRGHGDPRSHVDRSGHRVHVSHRGHGGRTIRSFLCAGSR